MCLASVIHTARWARPEGAREHSPGFTLGLQALRAWLLSSCPSGTKHIFPAEAFIKLVSAYPGIFLASVLVVVLLLVILLLLLLVVVLG
jgi:hypothetical protein